MRVAVLALLLVMLFVMALPAEKPAPEHHPPRILKRVEPQYTEEARTAKVEGSVTLRAHLSGEGRLEEISVVRGLGYGLDERAVQCVRQWVWAPAMRDGVARAVDVNIEVNFRLL